MPKQRITVELDDETISGLAALGPPIEVLAQLAHSAAAGVGRADHERRVRTDGSLQAERDKADTGVADEQVKADAVVQTARRRADQVVRTARDAVDREEGPQSTTSAAGSAHARTVLEGERASADALLARERATRKLDRARALSVERASTDIDLTGERSRADTVLLDQREANEQLVGATIRAHELADEAEASRESAEASERELRVVAEFREMFIGVLAHDLRNPLGSIVMAASLLLQRGRLDERDAAAATRIIRASQRITRMITQLLDLTRARLGGGIPIHPMPTELGEICRAIGAEFDAPVELAIEGDLTGTWDEDRLAEVLSNLVGNAIEHAAAETPVIVKARPDGAAVIVEIANQGEPIPADQLPFIFQPFRRARPRDKSEKGNLGLGLYIAYEIVRSHGGTLDAHSAAGTTTFVMRLPRRAPEVTETIA